MHRRFQLTLARVLHAVFWFAVAAALFAVPARLAAPIRQPDFRALFAVGALISAGTGVGLICGRCVFGAGRLKALLITIAWWQVVSLAMSLIYAPTLGRLIFAAYIACFGEVQESYGRYDRISTYSEIVSVTITATITALWLFNALLREAHSCRRAVLTFLAWQAGTVAVLAWSFETGFSMMINSLGWSIFGAPEDVYSFTNIVLHRIIGWLICTTPVAWIALCLYSASPKSAFARPRSDAFTSETPQN
jgi:hypothetical protein